MEGDLAGKWWCFPSPPLVAVVLCDGTVRKLGELISMAVGLIIVVDLRCEARRGRRSPGARAGLRASDT